MQTSHLCAQLTDALDQINPIVPAVEYRLNDALAQALVYTPVLIDADECTLDALNYRAHLLVAVAQYVATAQHDPRGPIGALPGYSTAVVAARLESHGVRAAESYAIGHIISSHAWNISRSDDHAIVLAYLDAFEALVTLTP